MDLPDVVGVVLDKLGASSSSHSIDAARVAADIVLSSSSSSSEGDSGAGIQALADAILEAKRLYFNTIKATVMVMSCHFGLGK